MKSRSWAGFLAIVFITISLAGCESFSRMGVAGTYVSEKNQENFMELKSDGSFYVQEGRMGLAGSYDIDGDQITLKTDMGFASRGKIEGNTVIDDEGERWTKK